MGDRTARDSGHPGSIHSQTCSSHGVRRVALVLAAAVMLGAALASPARGAVTSRPYWVRPITVTNTSGQYLSTYQTLITLDTQSLVAIGRMQADGRDIRFYDGCMPLPYYIESGMNTPSTRIWVRVPSLPPATPRRISIQYGDSSLAPMSSAAATFWLYDDFLGSSLDPSLWSVHIRSGYHTVSGGVLQIGSYGWQGSYVIRSRNAYAPPVVVEASVLAANGQWPSLTLLNAATWNGYSLVRDGNYGQWYFGHTAPSGPSFTGYFERSSSAGSPVGVWSVAWPQTYQQRATWPGGSLSFGGSYFGLGSNMVALGQLEWGAGQMVVDWVRVRSYAASEPTVTFGAEYRPGIDVSAISGPTSEGGATATFSMVLASQPAGIVNVGVMSLDTSEGVTSSGVAGFNPANWNVPQPITVTGVDDTLIDGDIPYTVRVAPASASECEYAGLDAPDVLAVNEDDDFRPAAGVSLAGVASASVDWGDYDNDGRLDLLVSGSSAAGRVTTLYRNEGGTFADASAALVGVSDGSAVWGDYDGDGDLDILLAGLTDGGPVAAVYRNDAGAFIDVGAGLTGVHKSSAAWGDADDDGDLDILLSGESASGELVTEIYRNTGGVFAAAGAGLTGVRSGAVAWGDYDGDGDLDVLVSGESVSGAFTSVYQNTDGVFAAVDLGLAALSSSAAAWGDYDDDGDLDLLLAGDLTARVYQNDAGVFTDTGALLAGVTSGSAAWGDFENDGDLDVLLTGSTGASRIAKIYRNDGGSFVDVSAPGLPGVADGAAAWGDFDADGDLDVATAGSTQTEDVARVYRNASRVANTAPGAPSSLAAAVDGLHVALSWAAAADTQTPADGLTYNLRLGTTPGGGEIVAAMAAPAGARRIAALGNVQHGLTARVGSLAPGDYYWSVQAVDAAFAGSPFAEEGSFTVLPCSHVLDPTSASLPTAGGSGSFTVTTGKGCAWTASPSDGWITLPGRTSGDDDATVDWSVVANVAGPRVGSITVADQTFTVDQAAAPCVYSIDPAGAAPAAAGGTFSFTVTTGSWCSWTAVGSDGWITFPDAPSGTLSGSGTTTISYSVAGNAAGARAGTIAIGGQTFTIDQAAAPCVYALAPASVSAPSSGTTGSFDVTTGSWCSWTAGPSDPWLTLTGTTAGNGPGTIAYEVLANGAAARSGGIAVGDQVFAVSQAGLVSATTATLDGVRAGSVAFGDFDGDDDLDVLLTGEDDSATPIAGVYVNDGTGGFSDVGAGLTGVAGRSSGAWGDFDRDGDLDILLAGTTADGSAVALVYRNDAGTFTDLAAGLAGAADGTAAWGDADGDGDLDVLLTGFDGAPVGRIYRNDGGSFTDAGVTLDGGGAAAWADADNDGDLDVLVTGNAALAPAATLYLNVGSGAFAPAAGALSAVQSGSVAWGDFDNDGDLDLLLTGNTGSARVASVYRNDGGVFADVGAGLEGVDSGSAAWGDLDDDGDLDILLAGEGDAGAVAKLYRNDGAGVFTELTAELTAVAASAGAWGDVDGDGDLDILLAGDDGSGATAILYANESPVANAAPAAPSDLAAVRTGSEVALSWTAAVDSATASAGLTYNLRVGTSPGAGDVVSPHAAAGGLRRTPLPGNLWLGTAALVKDLQPGVYYWSVQAVDASYAGSPFAGEGTFSYCVYAIDPAGVVASAGGLTGTIVVTAPAGCPWTAAADVAWITVVDAGSGDGSSTVRYSVDANPAAPRRGTLTLAGQTFTVDQDGGACSYLIDPLQASFTEAGGTGAVNVTAPAWCNWTAATGASWVTITGGAAGNGNGAVQYTVDPNTWTARSATISVAGLTFQLSQERQPVESQRAWHNWFAADTLETPYVGDFNGDGRTDVITFTRQNPLSVGDVYVALSNGRQFVDKNGVPDNSDKWHDWFAITTDETVVIGDYNGDGLDDIATWLGKTTRQAYVALSYGTGMTRELVWIDVIGSDPSDVLGAGDVDGDRKEDLICFSRSQGRVYVALSDGTRFLPPVEWHGFFAVSTHERPLIADVNGDRLADIVTFATDSPTAPGDVFVALSDGARFVDQDGNPNSSTKWHDSFAAQASEQVRIGDLDGDGRDDFFTLMPAPLAQCYTVRSEGSRMGPIALWWESVAPLATDVPQVGDANGDGQDDVIVFARSEAKVYVSLAP